jgi:acetyl esterase/lipase
LAAIPTMPLTAAEEAPVRVERNLIYGKGSDVDLQLDLARPPTGAGPFPALVFIHGGGWSEGTREKFLNPIDLPLNHIQRAAQCGYVAVAVSYRLTNVHENGRPKYPFPAQVQDVKCAVRWLRANAAQYRVDVERVGAVGGSAGGHLALMLALTDTSAGLEGDGGYRNYSSRVQAAVSIVGPTELARGWETTQGGKPQYQALLGGAPQQVAPQYKAASPLTYVSKDDPPVLTIHGDQDSLVPLEQAELLDAKMKEVGASHTLVVLRGQGHLLDAGARDLAQACMYAFFDRHLKNPKAASK